MEPTNMEPDNLNTLFLMKGNFWVDSVSFSGNAEAIPWRHFHSIDAVSRHPESSDNWQQNLLVLRESQGCWTYTWESLKGSHIKG